MKRQSTATSFVAPIPYHPPATLTDIPAPNVIDIARTNAGGYARSDDDALSSAKATLLVSAAYGVAALLITAGLLLVAWMYRWLGGNWPAYAYGGILVWGVVVLIVLLLNRRQGLHHSASGISHHEIDSRTLIAMHAIDTHADLLSERWRLEIGPGGRQ